MTALRTELPFPVLPAQALAHSSLEVLVVETRCPLSLSPASEALSPPSPGQTSFCRTSTDSAAWSQRLYLTLQALERKSLFFMLLWG